MAASGVWDNSAAEYIPVMRVKGQLRAMHALAGEKLEVFANKKLQQGYAKRGHNVSRVLTSNAILCQAVHLCCANLDFKGKQLLSSEWQHCGVEGLHADKETSDPGKFLAN